MLLYCLCVRNTDNKNVSESAYQQIWQRVSFLVGRAWLAGPPKQLHFLVFALMHSILLLFPHLPPFHIAEFLLKGETIQVR